MVNRYCFAATLLLLLFVFCKGAAAAAVVVAEEQHQPLPYSYAGPLPSHFCGERLGTIAMFTVWQPNFFEIAFWALTKACNMVGGFTVDGASGNMTLFVEQSKCDNVKLRSAHYDATYGHLTLFGDGDAGTPFTFDFYGGTTGNQSFCNLGLIPQGDYCAETPQHQFSFTVDANYGYTINVMHPKTKFACRASGSVWNFPDEKIVWTTYSQCPDWFIVSGQYNRTTKSFEFVGTYQGKAWNAQATAAKCQKGTLPHDGGIYCAKSVPGLSGSTGIVIHFGQLLYIPNAGATSYQQTIFNLPSSTLGQFSARGGYWLQPDNSTLTMSHARTNPGGIEPATYGRYSTKDEALHLHGTFQNSSTVQSQTNWNAIVSKTFCQELVPTTTYKGSNNNVSMELAANDHGYNTFSLKVTLVGLYPLCTVAGHYWLAVENDPYYSPVQISIFASSCTVDMDVTSATYYTTNQTFSIGVTKVFGGTTTVVTLSPE